MRFSLTNEEKLILRVKTYFDLALQGAIVQMVNQPISGKKMEKEAFKEVNLQHSQKVPVLQI